MTPKLNIPNLVRQLVPTHRRQPVRLWWLRALVGPLVALYDDFAAWRTDIRFRINLTSQVRVLEGYLNLKYDPTGSIRIVSFDDGLLWVGLESEGDNYHPRVGLESEPDYLVGIPLENEIRDSLGDVDFVVYIPAEVDAELIVAEIERYRLAGMTYKIVTKDCYLLATEAGAYLVLERDGETFLDVTPNDTD